MKLATRYQKSVNTQLTRVNGEYQMRMWDNIVNYLEFFVFLAVFAGSIRESPFTCLNN